MKFFIRYSSCDPSVSEGYLEEAETYKNAVSRVASIKAGARFYVCQITPIPESPSDFVEINGEFKPDFSEEKFFDEVEKRVKVLEEERKKEAERRKENARLETERLERIKYEELKKKFENN